jgi:hypothetical protein
MGLRPGSVSVRNWSHHHPTTLPLGKAPGCGSLPREEMAFPASPFSKRAEAKAPSGTGRMFLCPTLSKKEGMHACSQCFTCAHPSQARPTLYPPGHPHMTILMYLYTCIPACVQVQEGKDEWRCSVQWSSLSGRLRSETLTEPSYIQQ